MRPHRIPAPIRRPPGVRGAGGCRPPARIGLTPLPSYPCFFVLLWMRTSARTCSKIRLSKFRAFTIVLSFGGSWSFWAFSFGVSFFAAFSDLQDRRKPRSCKASRLGVLINIQYACTVRIPGCCRDRGSCGFCRQGTACFCRISSGSTSFSFFAPFFEFETFLRVLRILARESQLHPWEPGGQGREEIYRLAVPDEDMTKGNAEQGHENRVNLF